MTLGEGLGMTSGEGLDMTMGEGVAVMTFDQIAIELMDWFVEQGKCWPCEVEFAAFEFGATPEQSAMVTDLFLSEAGENCDDHSPFSVIQGGIAGTVQAMFTDLGWAADDWESLLADAGTREHLIKRGMLEWFDAVGLIVKVV